MSQPELGRLKGELRALREKQARLRYQVRYLMRQHTRLRELVNSALTDLDEGHVPEAVAKLEHGLERSQRDPDRHHTPAGARRTRRPRAVDSGVPPG